MENIYKDMGISDEVFTFAQGALNGLKERFEAIDVIAEANQMKVLSNARNSGIRNSTRNTHGFGRL